MSARTHGLSRKPGIYNSWSNMIQRTTNPKHPSYPIYGARGITVCKRWLKFDNFLEDMGLPPKGTSIERKDNNKGYIPGNCRWATKKDQQNNRRTNVLHTIDGVTKNTTQWLEHFGIKQSTFTQRVYVYGWPTLTALTTPPRKRG